MTYIDFVHGTEKEIPFTDCPDTVLALGNFDGVHIGHRSLLRETVRRARELSSEQKTVLPGVWLFRAPPSDILKDPPIPHLSSLEEKLSLFRELGIRCAFVEDFDKIGALSPQAFVQTILQDQCHCLHAVCGFNYSFGYRGQGTPALLRTLFGGAVSEIPPVTVDDLPVSSTRIRSLLADGKVREAAVLLGRPYSIMRPVLHGKALGRTIDFPTINQDFAPLTMIPRNGIYAVTVRFPDDPEHSTRYGISNIGKRPTVEQSDHINCETHILDFSGDLYGRSVEVAFIERLRDERKMSGLDELRATIRNDERTARRMFGLSTRE